MSGERAVASRRGFSWSRLLRPVGVMYVIAAVGLGAWTVNLWLSLADHAVAHHLPTVKALVGALLVALLVLQAVVLQVTSRRTRVEVAPPSLTMATIAVVVVSAVAEWFLLGSNSTTGTAGQVCGVLIVLTAAAAAYAGLPSPPLRIRRMVSAVAIVVLAAGVVAMVIGSAPSVLGRHQRMIWVGLDIAEVAAVLVTGIRLLQSRSALWPGTCACCLLFCDAVVNVSVATGPAFAAALAMACLEVPAAILSGVIAYRTARGMSVPSGRSWRDSPG